MSLIKCNECGNEVSTEAKTCPKCGVKVKKPTSSATKLAVILLGIAFVGAIVSENESASVPETPEIKAQKEAESKRYVAAFGTSKTIRSSMRDPESLKFETLLVNDDSSVVCAEYRARNGFGGMNRELMIVTKDKTSQSTAAWNKHCTKSMYDMMWAAK